MNRRSFGFWGVDLEPADFAKALAALGILGSHASLADAEEKRHRFVWRPPSLPRPDDAKQYAEAWTKLVASRDRDEKPRIEIDPGFDSRAIVDALWVHETLAHPAVDAASVYLRADEPVAKVVLAWPLRIGVLPSPASTRLLDQFRSYHYAGRLTKLVELSATERECDLLVLPFALKESVAELSLVPFTIRCDLAIVLGEQDATARTSQALIAAIRGLTKGAGVALAFASHRQHGDWFGALIDEIAHNQPFDVALWRATPGKGPRPLFIASRLLAQWTLARRVDRMREEIAAAAPPDAPIPLSPRGAQVLSLPSYASVKQITNRLEHSRDLSWDRESDMAHTAVELQESAEPVLRESAAPAPEARWIQAKVLRDGARVEQFRFGQQHEIRVRVAQEDREWLRGVDAFPDHELPDEDREHLLTVIFFDPQCMPEPQMGNITLPRTGASSEVPFFFIPNGTERIEARITICYQNRVLQTALLRGRDNAPIAVVTEAVIRPGLQSLSSMQRGDAAIVLNRSAAGEAGALKVGAGRTSYVSVEDLKNEIEWFDDQLSAIADDPDAFDGLRAAATVKMLIDFAQHGSLLYAHLTDSKDFEKLAAAERIQVVSAKAEARFPIEFVYDFDLDMGVSTLCANAEQALETGTCDADHANGTAICPLGFWGLRKIIERHVHDPETELPAGVDFGLQAVPIEGRNKLEILRAALLGASTRVDAVERGGIARVEVALHGAVAQPPQSIDNWSDWEHAILNAPTLLVLLVHVEEQQNKLQTMEIGDRKFLGAAFLKAKLIRTPLTNPPPLVLLLGCETGAAKMSFQGFVAQFRRGGAAAVISSGSTVLGRHVVPVTEELLAQLKTLSAGEQTSIGEAMLAIRRSMLAKGMPMVLALTAYGDADWRIA